jgi:hypothetical protein
MAHYKSLSIFLLLFISTSLSRAADGINIESLPGAGAGAGGGDQGRQRPLPHQDNRLIENPLLFDQNDAARDINR